MMEEKKTSFRPCFNRGKIKRDAEEKGVFSRKAGRGLEL